MLIVLVLFHVWQDYPEQKCFLYYTFALPVLLPLTLSGLKSVWDLVFILVFFPICPHRF